MEKLKKVWAISAIKWIVALVTTFAFVALVPYPRFALGILITLMIVCREDLNVIGGLAKGSWDIVTGVATISYNFGEGLFETVKDILTDDEDEEVPVAKAGEVVVAVAEPCEQGEQVPTFEEPAASNDEESTLEAPPDVINVDESEAPEESSATSREEPLIGSIQKTSNEADEEGTASTEQEGTAEAETLVGQGSEHEQY